MSSQLKFASLLVVLLCGLLVVTVSFSAIAQRIGIEAGHWKKDIGSKCPDGLTEVSITLSVANKAESILETRGYKVDILSASGGPDNWVHRGYSADAFVSLHVDQCGELARGYKITRRGGTRGTGTNGSGDASDRLVESLWEEYGKATGLSRDVSPGHFTDNFRFYYALGDVATGTPAAIIEMGWLSGDRDFISSSSGQHKMAQGIANAIRKFLTDNEPPPSQTQPTTIRSRLDSGWNRVYSTLDRRISPDEIEGCDTWDGVMYQDDSGNWKESPTSQVFPLNVNAVYVHSDCTGRITGNTQSIGPVQLSDGQWEVISSTSSWNDIKGNCQLASDIWTLVGSDWQNISPNQRMDGFKAYYLKVAEPCQSLKAAGITAVSSEALTVSPQQPGGPPGQPPPSEPPDNTLALTVNGERSISVAQGSSYTFEGSGFTPDSLAALYKVALPPAETSEKVLSTTADASGNIFIDEFSVDCDTFPVTHTYYAVDEASGRESNEVKLKVTQTEDCEEDGTAPPSQSPSPIAAELRPFDTNNNDLIDDPEFLQITNAWIEFEIEDTAFFKAIDLWIGQRAISSLSLDIIKTQPLELKTIGLTSHDHSTTFHAQGAGIASTQVDVYTLNGTHVFNQRTTSSHLRWNWRNSQGAPLANGVYLYQVTVKGPNGQIERSKVRKLMVLR